MKINMENLQTVVYWKFNLGINLGIGLVECWSAAQNAKFLIFIKLLFCKKCIFYFHKF